MAVAGGNRGGRKEMWWHSGCVAKAELTASADAGWDRGGKRKKLSMTTQLQHEQLVGKCFHWLRWGVLLLWGRVEHVKCELPSRRTGGEAACVGAESTWFRGEVRAAGKFGSINRELKKKSWDWMKSAGDQGRVKSRSQRAGRWDPPHLGTRRQEGTGSQLGRMGSKRKFSVVTGITKTNKQAAWNSRAQSLQLCLTFCDVWTIARQSKLNSCLQINSKLHFFYQLVCIRQKWGQIVS